MTPRRTLGAGLLALVVGCSLMASTPATASTAATARTHDDSRRSGRFDAPFTGFAPAGTVLRQRTPEQLGMDPAPLDASFARIRGWEQPSGSTHPLYAGAVALVGHDGAVVRTEASGWALRYADGQGTELPHDQWQPMREDTLFDLASVSKLFTSILVMQQVERGAIDLDAPVATYLPAFAANGKDAITVRQLLTHTSGLPAWLPLWSARPDKASRIQMVMDAKPSHAPGTTYLYSDLNLITLGVLVEQQTGEGLDQVLRERVTGPLGMTDTGYNPTDRARAAATEFEASPPRGMVQGEVHDENAWSLGGVAGHAGVFSTAHDLAVLAQALLNGGTYRGHRVLSEDSVRQMITNMNQAFPGDSHGLGFELDQRWYMSGLSSPTTAGHTGFTGTSIVIDFMSRSFAVLLTNRVHPSRSWGSNNPARREIAQGLALSLGVEPRHGRTEWWSGTADATTATLTTPVLADAGPSRLSFDLFVDTEETDPLTLESSTDGGQTWTPVPFTVRDRGELRRTDGTIATSGTRRWVQAAAEVPAGPVQVRWRYTTDALYAGRGVFVDGVRVVGGRGVLLDSERQPDALVAQGWSVVSR
ncbi:MAG TPA: serine hydrolase [Oryzihumus sp.]|nr:serine hydrolase [Oryzihumus sp.]